MCAQNEDVEVLRTKVMALSAASMKIGETLSQQSGGSSGSSSSSGGSSSDSKGKGDGSTSSSA
jgi:hypothetical protein